MIKNINKLEFITTSIFFNEFIKNNDSILKKIFYNIFNKNFYKFKNIKNINYFFINIEYYFKTYKKISNQKYNSNFTLIDYLNKNKFNTRILLSILNKEYINIKEYIYLYNLSKSEIVNEYFNHIKVVNSKITSALCSAIVDNKRPNIKAYYINKENKRILFSESNEIKKIKVLTL